jgi:hypothetical protein
MVGMQRFISVIGRRKMLKLNIYVDGGSASSHDNKKFRTRSVERQGGMVFGLWKMATAVIKPDIYIYIYRQAARQAYT